MKMNNLKPQPDLELKDGTRAIVNQFETNGGTVQYAVQFPRAAKRKPLDYMDEAEFQAWKQEHCK